MPRRYGRIAEKPAPTLLDLGSRAFVDWDDWLSPRQSPMRTHLCPFRTWNIGLF
jgi:hypothetical protein